MGPKFFDTLFHIHLDALLPQAIAAAVFLLALYFVIKKAVKDAISESNRPKS